MYYIVIGQSMPSKLTEVPPSEEFEITANSLGVHIVTYGELILRTLSCIIVNSQDDSHCELAVSFP